MTDDLETTMESETCENNQLLQQQQNSEVPPSVISSSASVVTLETLSEDVTSGANGGHHQINHPLLTPTSPRSVTTASISASGK